jgi:formamidopyrimidine-DNA glycosylase
LPEVETIRRDLESRILGKSIRGVTVRLPKMVKGSLEHFVETLQNTKVVALRRVGKLLQLELEKAPFVLLIHLKMTGQLLYQNNDDFVAGGHPFPAFSEPLPNKWTHIELEFDDGSHLYFNDLRQFGYWQIVTQNEQHSINELYGIEPLTPNFTWENFLERMSKKRGVLKAVLLDQTFISGLGNIYADEVCFLSGVLPARRVESLSTEELSRLYESCLSIIEKAIEHRGTSFKDFRDTEGREGGYAKFLAVYGHENEPCPRCGTPIEKIKLAGRGTHFCPHCQK